MNKDKVSALNRTLKHSDTTCLREQTVGELFVFNTTIMILTINHHFTYPNSYPFIHAKERMLENKS